MSCDEECTTRGVRVVRWCGEDHKHVEHDWTDRVRRERIHCYGHEGVLESLLSF